MICAIFESISSANLFSSSNYEITQRSRDRMLFECDECVTQILTSIRLELELELRSNENAPYFNQNRINIFFVSISIRRRFFLRWYLCRGNSRLSRVPCQFKAIALKCMSVMRLMAIFFCPSFLSYWFLVEICCAFDAVGICSYARKTTATATPKWPEWQGKYRKRIPYVNDRRCNGQAIVVIIGYLVGIRITICIAKWHIKLKWQHKHWSY